MQICLVPILRDNYVFLLRDGSGKACAAVDPGEAAPVRAVLRARGWHLTHILLTHHHDDHIGGAAELAAETGARVIGANADKGRIPAITQAVDDGDSIVVGSDRAVVLAVPGHTSGHIAFHFPEIKALFAGDTLFALGCGRVFEGHPERMWTSLQRLKSLPDDTRVYCAHEYTEANARFALSVLGSDAALRARAEDVARARALGRPTVPSTIGEERRTNLFLRADDEALATAIGLPGADAARVFVELRARKDVFRG